MKLAVPEHNSTKKQFIENSSSGQVQKTSNIFGFPS
jgi:hypothetical protein